MADYSRQLFDMFSGVGDTFADSRREKENTRRYDESAARQLFNDQRAQQNNERDFNFRGERAKVGDSQWSQEFGANNAYRGQSLALQREQLQNKAPSIQTFWTDDGREIKGIYSPNAPGGFVPVGGAKAAVAPRAQQMTAVDKKAILDADEGVQAGQNVISALDRAAGLSSKANAGWGAGARAAIGNNAPDWLVPDWVSSPSSSAATAELDNTVTAQALDQLKATFGGMPTEGERKILLDIQGSVNQPPAVREAIWKRAKAAAEKRVAFNRATAKAIRSGDYFSEGGGPSPQPQGNLAPGVEDGGYIFRGGDPSDPSSWEPAQ